MEKIKFSKEVIEDYYKELVKKYGKNDSLWVFDYCSDYGLELDNSTIDEIIIYLDDIVFIFDKNDNDYAYLSQFTMESLIEFYNGLVGALNEEDGNEK